MKPTLIRLRAAVSCLVLCFSLVGVQAQMRVGQPSASPDPSAALDVSGGPYATGSPYRGIAPPKVALIQASSASPITKPAVGLLVYNTATTSDVTPGYYYWEGNQWVRFSTNAKAGTARVAAVNGQSIPAYLMSQVASLSTPDIIYIADPGREGMFRYALNSSATVDSALVLPASGGRYLRILADKTITPQMFGAKGDGVTDDRDALQAFLNIAGPYKHRIPTGLYISSSSLSRIDKSFTTIEGDGYNKTEIRFTGDTDGLAIQNTDKGHFPDPAYGTIIIRGLKISSGGTKTGTKKGLVITNQHLQRPGPTVEGVAVWSTTSGQEWAKALEFYECSQIVASNIDIVSAGLTTTVGISVSTATGLPSVENDFSKFNIRNVKTAIQLSADGSPGIEGTQISDGSIVGAERGFYAVNNNAGSPYIGMRNVHINTSGGEAFYTEGYQQITLAGCLFYVQKNATTNAVPPRAIYLKNVIFLTGDVTAIAYNETNNILELDGTPGTGGMVNMKLSYVASYSATNGVYLATNYNGANFALNGVYNGGGVRTGTDFAGPGAGSASYVLSLPNLSSVPDNSTIRYNSSTGQWRPTFATKKLFSLATTNQTLSFSAVDGYAVNNASDNIILTIDRNTLVENQVIYIGRYSEASTGTITVKQNQTGAYIQDAANNFLTQVDIPTTGSRGYYWIFSGGHLRCIGGTWGLNPSQNLADLTNISSARTNLGLGTAAVKNTGDFVAASAGVPTSSLSYTGIVTTGMSTTAFTTVVNPGVLAADAVYLVKLIFDWPGNDRTIQTWTIPISQTDSGASGMVDLVGNRAAYAYSLGRYFVMRLVAGSNTFGLGIRANTSDMINSSARVSLYLTRLN